MDLSGVQRYDMEHDCAVTQKEGAWVKVADLQALQPKGVDWIKNVIEDDRIPPGHVVIDGKIHCFVRPKGVSIPTEYELDKAFWDEASKFPGCSGAVGHVKGIKAIHALLVERMGKGAV